VLEKFRRNKYAVLIAPTGYGRKTLSLVLTNVSKKYDLSAGLIHVVPYRASVREIYSGKFKNNNPSVGY
jgi:CRISPR-associated endonuclease/helicase Cas3